MAYITKNMFKEIEQNIEKHGLFSFNRNLVARPMDQLSIGSNKKYGLVKGKKVEPFSTLEDLSQSDLLNDMAHYYVESIFDLSPDVGHVSIEYGAVNREVPETTEMTITVDLNERSIDGLKTTPYKLELVAIQDDLNPEPVIVSAKMIRKDGTDKPFMNDTLGNQSRGMTHSQTIGFMAIEFPDLVNFAAAFKPAILPGSTLNHKDDQNDQPVTLMLGQDDKGEEGLVYIDDRYWFYPFKGGKEQVEPDDIQIMRYFTLSDIDYCNHFAAQNESFPELAGLFNKEFPELEFLFVDGYKKWNSAHEHMMIPISDDVMEQVKLFRQDE